MRRILLAITTWEWLLLLLILPVLAFTTSEWALALLMLPVLWLVRKLATGRFFPATPYDAATTVLALSVLISFTAVFDIELSFPKIAGVALGIAFLYAAIEHCRQQERGVWHVLATVIAAGTVFAAIAIFYTSFSGPFLFLSRARALLPAAAARLPGTVDGGVNANEIAGVLTWTVPLITAVVAGYWGDMWRSGRWLLRPLSLVLVICLLINVLVLLASGSRGGLSSVAVALVVMTAVAFRWGRWLLVGALVLAPVLLSTLGRDLLAGGMVNSGATFGLETRLEIWSRAIYGLNDFPFTGMSMNGFRRIVPVLYPLFTISADVDIAHAHNHLLQAGLDLGFLGLIAYLAFWLLAFGMLWAGVRTDQRQGSQLRPLQIGLVGALAGGWLFGILDAIALGARPGFIWWLLLALVFASTVAARQQEPVTLERETAV